MSAVAEQLIEPGYDIKTNRCFFRAIQDIVLIKPDPEGERLTESPIIILPESEGRWARSGVVIAAGPGIATESGFVAADVKAGDRVLYNQNLQTDYEYQGVKYALTRERELLAVLEY
jgi:co-chaperonin GroES (HSP10)